VNQETPTPLALPGRPSVTDVLYRRNTGYNIGAWDLGWRVSPEYPAYLFMQEECQVVRQGWLKAFVDKASLPLVGLVGECLSSDWDFPWDVLAERAKDQELPEHLVDGRPADRVSCYLNFFKKHGILAGSKGDHLQSLILFVRREVLQVLNGFPIGLNYGEAIAAEIGISKRVQALGLKICEVGPEPFCYVHHPQWMFRKYEFQASSR
jgi:hypothetical protein